MFKAHLKKKSSTTERIYRLKQVLRNLARANYTYVGMALRLSYKLEWWPNIPLVHHKRITLLDQNSFSVSNCWPPWRWAFIYEREAIETNRSKKNGEVLSFLSVPHLLSMVHSFLTQFDFLWSIPNTRTWLLNEALVASSSSYFAHLLNWEQLQRVLDLGKIIPNYFLSR